MLENSHAWMSGGASSSSIAADSYQYQLQSMWQKCWNTNQNLMHHLRFRERGPLKSWRPETMAEAIFSVLKEGLSLSQAARKYDIPYPTFVLYANRVHNMLGPSIDGGPDLRPKGRGRPQRILLGIWPDEHIKGVIKTVVFREAKELKDDTLTHMPYGRHSDASMGFAAGLAGPCPNGMPGTSSADQMSQEATAAAVAAVAHNIRQQMQMAAAAQQQQQHGEGPTAANLFNLPPHLASGGGGAGGLVGSSGLGPLAGGPPVGPMGMAGLAKGSISPALGSASNMPVGAASAMMGPRHSSSPCGGLQQIPHSMAVAFHMSGGPGPGPATGMLTQQQQHQLQQLHMQQQQQQLSHSLHHQHKLHQQQQPQQLHQQHLLFGANPQATTSILPPIHHATSTATTTVSSTKSTTSSTSVSPNTRRPSSHSDTPMHSPSLAELGLEMSFKQSRSFSPSRLFSDEIAELVGAMPTSSSSSSTVMTTAGSRSVVATTSSAFAAAEASTTATSTPLIAATVTTAATTTASSLDSSNVSSTEIKLEPLTTTSD